MTAKNTAPLFVSGCPRSGTSALALWLNTSPEVALGLERYQQYWQINKALPENAFSRQRFFDVCRGDTWYSELSQYQSMYSMLADRWDAAVLIGDKVPGFWRNLPGLFHQFPAAKLVHVIRDPFSVARSYKLRASNMADATWGAHRDVAAAINEWNASNKALLQFIDSAGERYSRQIFLLRYEDFIGNCVDIRQLERFLGVTGLQAPSTVATRIQARPDLLSEQEKTLIWAMLDEVAARRLAGLCDGQRADHSLASGSGGAKRLQWYHASDRDAASIEYGEFTLPGCNYLFRGRSSPLDFSAPFIVCIGSATTFGRFVKSPFAEQLEGSLGIPVLNLGIGGGRLESFLADPSVMTLLDRASLVIVEMMSARGYRSPVFSPNHVAANHGEFHDYFELSQHAKADPQLASLFHLKKERRPVFVDWIYERIYRYLSKSQRDLIRDSILAQNCNDFSQLAARFAGKILALYVSKNDPRKIRAVADPKSYEAWAGSHPHFVDQSVLDFVDGLGVPIVSVTSTRGVPYQVKDWLTGAPAPLFKWQADPSLNSYYPSQEMHDETALAITDHLIRIGFKFRGDQV